MNLLNLTDPRGKAARIWFATMLATAIAVAYAFRHIDVPLAIALAPFAHHISGLGDHLGSAVLLAVEALVALALVLRRVFKGSLMPLAKIIAVACLSSIAAYAVNASVLKVLFGVATPTDVLAGARHVAHFAQGSYDSSFPSGHMVLAGAFAGVPMRHYPKLVLPLSGLLLMAGILLVAGSWHFLSDVLAGAFAGLSAGFLAAEILAAHERAMQGRF